MQRVIAALGQHAIDRNQILHRRDLGGNHDLVALEADFLGALGGVDRRARHGLAHHRARVDGRLGRGVDVHQMRQHLLVERAPIRADAHGLVVLDRQFDDGAELLVLLFLEADIARIDAVFGERLAAGRVIGQKLVADVMKIADQRDVDAHPVELFADVRDGGSRLVAVDGDPHQLRARPRQRGDLRDGGVDVGRVGVGHGLHDNRRAAAHRHGALAGSDRYGAAAMSRRGFGVDGLREEGFGVSGHGFSAGCFGIRSR